MIPNEPFFVTTAEEKDIADDDVTCDCIARLDPETPAQGGGKMHHSTCRLVFLLRVFRMMQERRGTKGIFGTANAPTANMAPTAPLRVYGMLSGELLTQPEAERKTMIKGLVTRVEWNGGLVRGELFIQLEDSPPDDICGKHVMVVGSDERDDDEIPEGLTPTEGAWRSRALEAEEKLDDVFMGHCNQCGVSRVDHVCPSKKVPAADAEGERDYLIRDRDEWKAKAEQAMKAFDEAMSENLKEGWRVRCGVIGKEKNEWRARAQAAEGRLEEIDSEAREQNLPPAEESLQHQLQESQAECRRLHDLVGRIRPTAIAEAKRQRGDR